MANKTGIEADDSKDEDFNSSKHEEFIVQKTHKTSSG